MSEPLEDGYVEALYLSIFLQVESCDETFLGPEQSVDVLEDVFVELFFVVRQQPNFRAIGHYPMGNKPVCKDRRRCRLRRYGSFRF